MKRLEDIPKKNIYQVPEGYFDQLPGIIQARAQQHDGSLRQTMWLKYSLGAGIPALLLFVWAFFHLAPNETPKQAEEILAAIETPELVAYLENTGAFEDELFDDEMTFSEIDAGNIEDEVYAAFSIASSQGERDEVVDEYMHDILDSIN